MPFNKETGAAGGRKGGGKRWEGKDPTTYRNKPLLIKVTPTEYESITAKAKAEKLSKAELIVRAVGAFEGNE